MRRVPLIRARLKNPVFSALIPKLLFVFLCSFPNIVLFSFAITPKKKFLVMTQTQTAQSDSKASDYFENAKLSLSNCRVEPEGSGTHAK